MYILLLCILLFYFLPPDHREQDDGRQPRGDLRAQPAAAGARRGRERARDGHRGQHGGHQHDARARAEPPAALHGARARHRNGVT